MTDLDPQITAILDRLVPAPDEAGEWERVLADGSAVKQPRARRWRNPRVALALAALAALAAALAFVPALAGQGYFWFLEHAPKPTTPVVTVTSITDQSGATWQLTAYQSEEKGLCIQLTGEGRTGVGSCGPALPINATVYVDAHGAFVLGPVTADAQRVVITGAGKQVEATTVAAPEALQTDIKFYVAQLPEGMPASPLTLKALDAEDHTVATWAVPAMRRP